MKTNKKVLYISSQDRDEKTKYHWYKKSLLDLGYDVYNFKPQNKKQFKDIFSFGKFDLIFMTSDISLRNIDISIINKNNTNVVINMYPLNSKNKTFGGEHRHTDPGHLEIIEQINNKFLYTDIIDKFWPIYMDILLDEKYVINHLPKSCYLYECENTDFTKRDIAYVGNFRHKPETFKKWMMPFFKRFDMIKKDYLLFGDIDWQHTGLKSLGNLVDIDEMTNIYQNSSSCPNFHTQEERETEACINDRSFSIPMCGGLQICDNPAIKIYFGDIVDTASSVSQMIKMTEEYINDPEKGRIVVRSAQEHSMQNHSCFSRLQCVFKHFGMEEYYNKCGELIYEKYNRFKSKQS